MSSGGRTRIYRVGPFLILGVLLVALSGARAQEAAGTLHSARTHDVEAWEPEDLRNRDVPTRTLANPARVFSDGAVALIEMYQRSISPNSIQRCPFHPSCSNFALIAIRRHGFLAGVCLFIDRNLYRENAGIMEYYGLIRLPSGVLKLDDHFFLGDAR